MKLISIALLLIGSVLAANILFQDRLTLSWLGLGCIHGIIPYGLVLGIFGSVLPPLLYSIGMPHVGSGLGTILTSSELPVVVIMSSLVLGEVISWSQWIGVIIILGGIVNSNTRFYFF
ncbi:drug/metabolite transporter (DMT)-like permease [Paenibacillus sp. RC84]